MSKLVLHSNEIEMISIAFYDYSGTEQRDTIQNNPNKQCQSEMICFHLYFNGISSIRWRKKWNSFWNWINWTKLIYNMLNAPQCIMHSNHNDGNCVLRPTWFTSNCWHIIQPYRFSKHWKMKTHRIASKTIYAIVELNHFVMKIVLKFL